MESGSSFSSIRERLNSISAASSQPSAPSSSFPSFNKKGTGSKKRNAASALPDISPMKENTPMKLNPRGRGKVAPNQSNSNSTSNSKASTAKSTPGSRRSTSSKMPTSVEFKTILRMRPSSQEEEGDEIALSICKDSRNTVLLHPLKEKSTATPRQKSKIRKGKGGQLEYNFDCIIDSKCSQDDMYNEMGGLSMAQDALGPLLFGSKTDSRDESSVKNHVVFSLGVSNSGKTFTLLGGEDGNRENEGMIPRLIDDLFLPEKNASVHSMLVKAATNCTQTAIDPSMVHMELELSMVHIHKDQVFDMLSSYAAGRKSKRDSSVSKMISAFETTSRGQPSMQELKISKDEKNQDFVVRPTVVRCTSSTKARDILNLGMKQNTTASTKFNKQSSRGHTLITLHPVMRFNIDNKKSGFTPGASITIIDMAGIERTSANDMNRLAIRESISINSSISAVLQCLRSIKSQQESLSSATGSNTPSKRSPQLIPYRENKLTMLMQPLFSGGMHHGLKAKELTTNVKVLLSVYPGARDYNEKKSLLSDCQHLKGLSLKGACVSRQDSDDGKSSNENAVPMSIESSHAEFKYGKGGVVVRSERQQEAAAELSIDRKENIDSSTMKETSSLPSPLQHKSPLNRLANAVKGTPLSSKKRKVETHILQERIRNLEAEKGELKKKHEKGKKICIALTHENKDLRKMLDEAREREAKTNMACEENVSFESDAEELLRSREWRQKNRNLLGSPLVRHMKAVEGTTNQFTGNLGSYRMKRSPFKLTALMEHPKTPDPATPQKKSSEDEISFASA